MIPGVYTMLPPSDQDFGARAWMSSTLSRICSTYICTSRYQRTGEDSTLVSPVTTSGVGDSEDDGTWCLSIDGNRAQHPSYGLPCGKLDSHHRAARSTHSRSLHPLTLIPLTDH